MLVSILDKSVVPNPVVHGGKGAGLIWMQQQGVNVPPALIIPTSVCVEYMKSPKTVMKTVAAALKENSAFFSDIFGYQPLLSVRSGARSSMPGMMDTILNVGLDTKSLNGWETRLGSDCAIDSFKRLICMYGNVVGGVAKVDLEAHTLPEALVKFERATGKPFPDSKDQLLTSVEAVFKSWNNERAKTYRQLNNIPDDWGTAVVIQAMVFGNFNDDSGTGVLFTRDPDSGEDKIVGEFLMNAQGEDVVAGTATPMKLDKLASWDAEVSAQLIAAVTKLEQLKGDVQDVEFTIQDKVLYILQTRTAKRSAAAAVKIALDMRNEGMIETSQMIARVSELELDLANQSVISPAFKGVPDFTGIPACSGVVTGRACLTSAEAIKLAATGVNVILVTDETTPDDIGGMNASVGIVTMTGGSTSHAAVVARSMNRCCVVGVGKEHCGKFVGGEIVSVDGATGRVWFGEVPVVGGNNPLVGVFRAEKVGATPLLVKSAPAFKVDSLVISVGDMLHFEDIQLKDILSECVGMAGKVGLHYVDGVSAVFMSNTDINARLKWVADYVNLLVVGGVSTVYGFTYGENSVPMTPRPTLEELVLAKKSMFISAGSKKWTDAEMAVMEWKASTGVAVTPWNTKGGSGPKAYSVENS